MGIHKLRRPGEFITEAGGLAGQDFVRNNGLGLSITEELARRDRGADDRMPDRDGYRLLGARYLPSADAAARQSATVRMNKVSQTARAAITMIEADVTNIFRIS